MRCGLVARLCRRWRICGLHVRLVGGRIVRVRLLLLLLLDRWGEKRVLSLGSEKQRFDRRMKVRGRRVGLDSGSDSGGLGLCVVRGLAPFIVSIPSS